MQSIFRLPWCTDQIAPKMQNGKAALDSVRASPVLDMPMLSKLKRKRTDSPEPSAPFRVQPAKRPRAEGEVARQSPPVTARVPAESEREHVMAKADDDGVATGLRYALEHQPAVSHGMSGLQAQDKSQASIVHQTIAEPQASLPKAEQSAGASMLEDVSMTDAQAFAIDARGCTPLQQVIENEFNMQILMKHNELRLIEQEMAKCQVALEQLRRCELRPYLGAVQPSADVSAGTGSSIAPPVEYSRPTHAAPHGVTDGPYTRHYRQWLLHDPQFDSVPFESMAHGEHSVPDSARSTRNAGSARKSVQKSLSIPGRAVDSMKSLPNYPAHPKDKSAPLVLRRSTDGQLVKLICNNCLRGNFSSIQGFLNHCRIAHKVDYKSHDAAAVDCGRLLDEQEVANLPPDALTAAVVHKPSTSRSASTTTTPFKTHSFVHPMNATSTTPARHSISGHTNTTAAKPIPVTSLVSTAQAQGSSSFTPSAQVPRLSAHFAKYNLGGNLEQAITDARQKVDLGVEEVMSPDELDSASPSTPLGAGARSGLGVPRAGSLAPPGGIGRPQSRKGIREPAQRHRPSPLMPAPPDNRDAHHLVQSEIPESPRDRSLDLSPHTADSNPGLVSDHEDDDHGSASEDEVPQAAIAHSLGVSRGCTDSMDLDVAVDDDIDGHGVVIRRNSMIAADDRGYRPAGSPSRKFGAGNKGA